MSEKKQSRVRFAPSPTGMLHLGNIRTALMNYLFTKQNNGDFILRIEDTDPARNFDPGAKKIIADMQWLDLDYDEGPEKDGPHQPYFQSERQKCYQKKLLELIDTGTVYRCFCSSEELQKRRKRQIALKQPPRYDRQCLKLTNEEIQEKLNKKEPFIWRFKLDHDKKITIHDLAHGDIIFDLKNFSDFPLTRQDGTFTFMFANFVDDALMNMTHVLRGEDHLTNTAGQAALFIALGLPLPTYWHLPILANIEGKKLSKRDFGFALHDLKQAGFLPEALINYLAIIGGGTFTKEIMSKKELIQNLDFKNISTTGQVKYDLEKLKWINHKWINQYEPSQLTEQCLPFLRAEFPEADKLDKKKLSKLIQTIKSDLTTLADVTDALRFYFIVPEIKKDLIDNYFDAQLVEKLNPLIKKHLELLTSPLSFAKELKKDAKEQQIKIKDLFGFLRFALTGQLHGPSITDLVEMLGVDEVRKRIEKVL